MFSFLHRSFRSQPTGGAGTRHFLKVSFNSYVRLRQLYLIGVLTDFRSTDRLKSSILAAGSAISESLSQASVDGTPPVSNQPGGAGIMIGYLNCTISILCKLYGLIVQVETFSFSDVT